MMTTGGAYSPKWLPYEACEALMTTFDHVFESYMRAKSWKLLGKYFEEGAPNLFVLEFVDRAQRYVVFTDNTTGWILWNRIAEGNAPLNQVLLVDENNCS